MAAKVGLAAQLAKQAAQAARDEVSQTESHQAAVASKAAAAWKVPTLPEGFDLSLALDTATNHVVSYYRQILAPEGVQMALEGEAGSVDLTQQGDDSPLQNQTVAVREGETGRLVRSYTQTDLLTMFAAQRQATGVIVDGQV